MIGISKLYCGTVEPSDALRYGRDSSKLPSHLLQFSADKRPVVVWNVTQQCNLKCVHCYAHAKATGGHNELTTRQGKELIDDLARFGVPVLLFSGGEPLCRDDLFELKPFYTSFRRFSYFKVIKYLKKLSGSECKYIFRSVIKGS